MTHAIWWETEGSAMRPLLNEDIEEFAKRITAIAWSNGEYIEREACLKICEAQAQTNYWEGADVCAEEIRTRGQK